MASLAVSFVDFYFSSVSAWHDNVWEIKLHLKTLHMNVTLSDGVAWIWQRKLFCLKPSDVTEHHFQNLAHLLPVFNYSQEMYPPPSITAYSPMTTFVFHFCAKSRVLLEITWCIKNQITIKRIILTACFALKWDEIWGEGTEKIRDLCKFWRWTLILMIWYMQGAALLSDEPRRK